MDFPTDDRLNSISAPIGYIANLSKYDEEIPYYLLGVQSTAEVPETNIELIKKNCLIKDMRLNDAMTLEANGFQLFRWPEPSIHVRSDYKEVEKYCNDMAQRVAQELQAEEAFVFDFRVEWPQILPAYIVLT